MTYTANKRTKMADFKELVSVGNADDYDSVAA
jgi:hypothetical protein